MTVGQNNCISYSTESLSWTRRGAERELTLRRIWTHWQVMVKLIGMDDYHTSVRCVWMNYMR